MSNPSLENMRELINEWAHLDYILPEDIPYIELYMDQVTTFMDKQLINNKRNEEDKILTKTMINNYTKNNLLPPPDKKKYSRDHIILLIYIYYLKNFISISDIQDLLTPMIENYFESDKNSSLNLTDIYKTIFDLEKSHRTDITKSIYDSKLLAESQFKEADNKYLHDLAFILIMSYDIYLKKQIIEKMIDNLKPPIDTKEKVKDKPKEKVKVKKPINEE